MVKEIQLTQGKITLVDEQDYSFLMQWEWYALKGSSTFYAARRQMINGKYATIYMHREVLRRHSTEDGEGLEADHINRDGLDNQRNNLRWATHKQNHGNTGIPDHNTSGFKGVGWHQGRWHAVIKFDGKTRHIASFDTIEEAARAYDEAARKHFGEFARTNFPKGV